MSWGEVKKINSNMEKPLNIQMIEQAWAMQISDASVDWGFRQEGYVGQALWYYGELWKYADEDTMEIIVALPTIDSIVSSTIAMDAISASTIAREAIYASSLAVAKYSCALAGYDASKVADMAALAQSSAAMEAVTASTIAMEAVTASTIAMEAVSSSSIARTAVLGESAALKKVQGSAMAIGKFAAGCAGLNPSAYADMAAVASASAAMSAIAASSTAMSAIESSNVAISTLNSKLSFTEKTGITCGANSSLQTYASGVYWVSQAWNSSSDSNTSYSLIIGLRSGNKLNLGNFSTTKTRQNINKFVSPLAFATTFTSTLNYAGVRYCKIG